ncbi:hypothetical protein GY45DRAFT_1367001 [Cubamyces sp. BRFM 1775]|nr:hypothetical protein GY45DRAFT_1367001 [Cubamyces sp. BRFM 1775]
MDGHNKRKRDYEGTVVTFYTPDTTFRRVFKGQSLEETKDLVRKKLGLSNDTSIRFSQLHEGRHIDLEDEDDFEAFQHLARHSLSLDLSVFVGNTGPPIFSHMPSAPASHNQVVLKKKKKNRADGPPTAIPPEVTSERSTPASVPIARPSVSTIDTNGMPKKKRKRGEDAGSSQLQGMSPQDIPTRAKDGSRAEEHASSEHSKKKSRKDKTAGATLASDPLPLASASREPPSVPVGSKRKRQDTPEVTTSRSSAPSVVAAPSPRSPSPSSPIRKKRKKEKRVQVVEEPSTPAAKTTENAKKDKKGKRKADEAAQPMEPPIAVEAHVSEPGEGDAADAEDNGVLVNTPKKDKKRKKKRIASHEASEPEAQPSQPPAGTPKKKKRKHKETGSIDDTSAPPDPTSATDEPSVAAKALKEKRKKPKASELTTDMEDSPVVVPAELATIEAAPSVPVEAQPVSGKRKRDRKSKANETLAVLDRSMVAEPTPEVVPEEAIPGSSSAPVLGEAKPKEGKKKRRKTLAADTSVDPDASSASISAAEVHQVEAPSASAPSAETTPSKKRKKRKSVAVSPSQRPSDPEGTFAIVQAAVQAILARAPAPAATQEREHPPSIPEPEPEPILPGRKRKAGQSKLRQAWGPEDIADDDQPSASVSRAVAQDLDTAASEPAQASSSSASVQLPSASASPFSASAQLAKQSSKAVNGKKGRPSSVPSCPICDKATAHPRSECPVVQGGPESLRVRIAQLKKTGRNIDLVDELEVLLKEAQRRRKSLGDQRAGGVPAPINVPPGSGHTSDEATPSPVFPLSAAKFTSPTPSRPPLPRVPAGSEISEVAVESKDEGSSNESESEDDSEEERNDRDNVASTSVALPDVSVTDLASVDLEALLRGPVKPRGSILNQIPSESTTEEEKESDDDARPDEDVDLSEEEKNDRAYRRLSRKLERAASSSEDEPEPEPEVEPGTADVDSAETFVPPTIMDADPNDTVGQVPDIEEADVSMADPDVLPETSAGSPSKGQAVQDDAEGAVTKSPTEERSDPGYESDAGDAATPASPSMNGREKAKPGDESLEVEQATEEQSGPDVSSAGRGDDNRVEHTADVDGPVASQESPAPPERSRNEPLSSPSDAAPGAQSDVDEAEAASDEEHGVEGVHNAEGEDASESEDVDEAMVDKLAEEQREVDQALSEKDDDEVDEEEPVPNTSAEREQSPELGGPESVPEEVAPEPTPPPPPLRQLDPITEDVEMHPSSSSRPASSLDLHRDHDPSDPIESLGSFADISERRNALDEDPIEDADADHQSPKDPSAQDGLNQTASSLDELQEKGTPPPAAPRTPGTISRMKDRYGRLSRKEKLSSLSEQLLGSIPSSSQPEPEPAVEGNEPEQQNAGDEAQPAPELVMTQEAGTSSQQTKQEEDQNARPRRTTRVTTRRTSAMPRGTTEPPAPAPTAASVALPPATEPAAAPAPKRRGGRLTAEEKAAREAEKKAGKERKAAEKKAEKEAKEAAKRAEKEAKEAAKRAEKEAKEAAKRAAQQEKEKEKEGDDAPKKGRTRAARGRATAAKPVSTRSRAVAKAETEEPEAPADPPASSTPGFSKVSWTTLPHPQTQSEIAEAESSMVDELQPSSPGQTSPAVSRSPEPVSNLTTNTEKDEADVSREVTITQDRSQENEDGEASADLPAATPKPPARQKEPLFIPSSSQFPNTPFPGDGLPESTPYANGAGRGNDSDSEAGEDAEDAQEGDDVFKVPRMRPRANWEPPYRRLSDIASQQLFSPTNIPSPALFAASQSQPRKSGFNHQAEDDDDDEDDESDGGSSSGSDAERKKSHIPQERRAGAGVQKKKKPGLLASLG